mmetsp:Transcript_25233/g.39147  ORF Transcript_25233/g.39147 Transcript_25233/m.39147 type:complete len:104 (-) Transcript_25233:32-343(-)
MLISSIFGIRAFRCMDSLPLLVTVSDWNGEKEEDPGRNRDVEGDKSDGNNFGACRIIVGELNAATKSELPPPPPRKKDSMLQYSCCLTTAHAMIRGNSRTRQN